MYIRGLKVEIWMGSGRKEEVNEERSDKMANEAIVACRPAKPASSWVLCDDDGEWWRWYYCLLAVSSCILLYFLLHNSVLHPSATYSYYSKNMMTKTCSGCCCCRLHTSSWDWELNEIKCSLFIVCNALHAGMAILFCSLLLVQDFQKEPMIRTRRTTGSPENRISFFST